VAANGKNQQIGTAVFFGLLMLGLPFIGLAYVQPTRDAAENCVLNMLLLPLVLFVAICLEQLVTAAVGRLLGDRSAFVVLGAGPIKDTGTIRGTAIIFRLVPVSSMNGIVTTRPHGQRTRLGIAMLAGASVLVTIVAVAMRSGPPWGGLMPSFANRVAFDTILIVGVGTVALLSFVGAIATLFNLNGLTTIDAAALLVRQQLAYVLDAELLIARGAFVEAEACARRALEKHPDSALVQYTLASALTERDAPEAFAIVEALARSEDVPVQYRAAVNNLWAWQCCMSDRDELRGAADTASAAALAAAPKQPAFLDTRGHVLLWNGKHDEAAELLARAYKLGTTRSARASSAAGMAMASVARSRIDDAVMWLDRARAEDMHPQLIARATAAVDPLHRR
jgi:hypothetical protein